MEINIEILLAVWAVALFLIVAIMEFLNSDDDNPIDFLMFKSENPDVRKWSKIYVLLGSIVTVLWASAFCSNNTLDTFAVLPIALAAILGLRLGSMLVVRLFSAMMHGFVAFGEWIEK